MEIYLDNSATTKPYKEVIDKMVYALDTDYANPSSLHRKGVEVEKNIKNIRQSIAKTLGAKDKEIYFTSGGTESNNTIIRGIVALNKKRKNHIISTTIEHPSVLNTLKDLESEGCEVTYLEVDKNGKIDIEEFKNALKPTTCLVTIMHGNKINVGLLLPYIIRKLITVVGIVVKPQVLITKKVIILLVASSFLGFNSCKDFIALRPNGVAAFPSPKILATIFEDI